MVVLNTSKKLGNQEVESELKYYNVEIMLKKKHILITETYIILI